MISKILDHVKNQIDEKSGKYVFLHIKNLGMHFHYFGQDFLRLSAQDDLSRMFLHKETLKYLTPSKVLLISASKVFGLKRAELFFEKISIRLTIHNEIMSEVFEQVDLAKDKVIHDRIALPLLGRLEENSRKFHDEMKDFMIDLERIIKREERL